MLQHVEQNEWMDGWMDDMDDRGLDGSWMDHGGMDG